MKFTKEHLPALKYALKKLKNQLKYLQENKVGVEDDFEISHYICDNIRLWSKNGIEFGPHNEKKYPYYKEITEEISRRIEGNFDVTEWLRKNGYMKDIEYSWKSQRDASILVQKYRCDWLLNMIEEANQE